jgi:DNA-directed RNA polymerase omega subunit
MRALWKNIGAMADTLPSLQEVSDELAANSGVRSCGVTYAFSTNEASIARVEARLKIREPLSNQKG